MQTFIGLLFIVTGAWAIIAGQPRRGGHARVRVVLAIAIIGTGLATIFT